jgi:hypothetical protein
MEAVSYIARYVHIYISFYINVYVLCICMRVLACAQAQASAWEEKEVNGSLPYPGKDKFENFYLAAEAPQNLQVDSSGKSSSNKAKSENKPGKLTLKSLKEYKIQQ